MFLKNIFNENQLERALIIRLGNCIGFAFVIGFAFNEVVHRLFLMLYYATGVYPFSNDVAAWVYQIVMSTVMFTLPFVILSPLMNVRIGRVCRFKRAEKGTAAPVILMGVGFIIVSNYLGNLCYVFLSALGLGSKGSTLSTDASSGIFIPIIAIIAGSVLPAFLEEFALRGVTLGAARRHGSGFAIIVSALIFSLMHGNLVQIPFAFVMGLYLGFAVEKTGSIWVGIILHLINNFFAFGLEILEQFVNEAGSQALGYIYYIVAMLLGFVGIVWASRKKDFFKFGETKEKSEHSFSGKLTTFLLTPGMVLFFLYIGYQIANIEFLG